MTNSIRKSALYTLVTRHSDFDFDHHIATTAPGDYDVWNGDCLPMEYSEAAAEYDAIRNGCGVFDASPMKKYRFRGGDAGQFLDRVLTASVSSMGSMRATYGLLCNEDGYLFDDGILIKIADDDYLFLITEIDLEPHFAAYNDFEDLEITEVSSTLAGLAVQGPKSCAVLQQFGFSGIESMAPFEMKHYELGGHRILVGRLGFTGDLGYELWFPPDAIDDVGATLDRAEEALDIKILGYGLTAVNICRLEAGMIVPGWDTAGQFEDMEKERTPFELGLGWNVKLGRVDDFVGKEALTEHKTRGPRFRMKGFRIDVPDATEAGTIEDGQLLYADIDGEQVEAGSLPSTVWHVTDNQWIGFASVKAAYADCEHFYVHSQGEALDCRMCKLPFVDFARRNQTPA